MAVGVVTTIYEDPMTRLHPEGLALITGIYGPHGDPKFLDAYVVFVDEPGEDYRRLIYRREE